MTAPTALRPLPARAARGITRWWWAAFCVLAAASLVACAEDTVESATPTPFPDYDLTEDQLALIPFEPEHLGDDWPMMWVSADSGRYSNEDIASGTFDQADDASTWEGLGRSAGYRLNLEALDPQPLLVQSGVDVYADRESARRAFARLARDFWDTEGQAADGFTLTDARERTVSGLGDEALLQSAHVDSEVLRGSLSSIGFRRGNLIASVIVFRFEGAPPAGDPQALARLLDERITAVIEGAATWTPARIPSAGEQPLRPPLPPSSPAGAGSGTGLTEVQAWAASFCSAAENTWTDWSRAQEEWARRTGGQAGLSEYRAAARDLINGTFGAGSEFRDRVNALDVPEDAAALGILRYRDALDAYTDWETNLYFALLARVEATTTTGELAGVLVEYGVYTLEEPLLHQLFEAYMDLDPGVLIALSAVGPCGQWTPGDLANRQLI